MTLTTADFAARCAAAAKALDSVPPTLAPVQHVMIGHTGAISIYIVSGVDVRRDLHSWAVEFDGVIVIDTPKSYPVYARLTIAGVEARVDASITDEVALGLVVTSGRLPRRQAVELSPAEFLAACELYEARLAAEAVTS